MSCEKKIRSCCPFHYAHCFPTIALYCSSNNLLLLATTIVLQKFQNVISWPTHANTKWIYKSNALRKWWMRPAASSGRSSWGQCPTSGSVSTKRLSRSPASFIKYFATCSNQRLNINLQQSSLKYSCLLLATKGQQNQLKSTA